MTWVYLKIIKLWTEAFEKKRKKMGVSKTKTYENEDRRPKMGLRNYENEDPLRKRRPTTKTKTHLCFRTTKTKTLKYLFTLFSRK